MVLVDTYRVSVVLSSDVGLQPWLSEGRRALGRLRLNPVLRVLVALLIHFDSNF